MADPFRQTAVSVGKNTHFSRKLDPFPPIHLAGGGGRRAEKKLDVRVSFGSPPIDLVGGKGLHTAYVACVRVKLAGAAQSIFRKLRLDPASFGTVSRSFPRVGKAGKDTHFRDAISVEPMI